MPSASGLDYQSFDPPRLATHHLALVTAFETEADVGCVARPISYDWSLQPNTLGIRLHGAAYRPK